MLLMDELAQSHAVLYASLYTMQKKMFIRLIDEYISCRGTRFVRLGSASPLFADVEYSKSFLYST